MFPFPATERSRTRVKQRPRYQQTLNRQGPRAAAEARTLGVGGGSRQPLGMEIVRGKLSIWITQSWTLNW
jgi:hypothetical protein